MTKTYISQVRAADDDEPETYELAYVITVKLIQVPTSFIEQFGTDVFRETKGEKKLIFTPITDAAQKQVIKSLGE